MTHATVKSSTVSLTDILPLVNNDKIVLSAVAVELAEFVLERFSLFLNSF